MELSYFKLPAILVIEYDEVDVLVVVHVEELRDALVDARQNRLLVLLQTSHAVLGHEH